MIKSIQLICILSFVFLNTLFTYSQNASKQKLDNAIKQNVINEGSKEKQIKKSIDSLLLEINATKQDTNKIKLYLKVCDLCEITDNIKYSEPIFKLTDKLLPTSKDSITIKRLIQWRYEALIFQRIFYQRNNDLSKTEENLYKQHLEKALKYKDYQGYAYTVRELSEYYFKQGKMLKRINCLEEGYDNLSKLKYYRGVSIMLIQMAFFYAETKDTTAALNNINKAIENEKLIKDASRNNRGYVIRGNLYRDLGQYSKALNAYDGALTGYKTAKDNHSLADVYRQIGYLYQNKKDYIKAIDNFEIGEKIAQSSNDIGLLVQFLIGKGDALASLERYEEAIKEHKWLWDKIALKFGETDHTTIVFFGSHLAKDYVLAKQFGNAKKILDVISPITTVAVEKSNIENLAYRTDSALGNYKDALLHYHNFIQEQIKLNDAEVAKAGVQRQYKTDIEKQKAIQEKENAIANEEKKKQSIILFSIIGILFLLMLFAGFIYKSLQKTKYANTIIAQQKHIVEEKQKEIIESITYAKRLQEAILPPQEFIDKHIPNNFILYKPKDLVAGDFYWAEKINDLFFIAAADSTGHGVPGAMVSVVCSNALNRTIKEFNQTETGKILDKTRELVLETFEKSTSEVKDGMDISLLCINSKNRSIFWSGANNPLWYIQDNVLKEIKADKQPIGKTEYPKPFTSHQIEYKENTKFYLFTDGFADQFGGPNGKKFKYKKFSDLLLKHSNLLQNEQSLIIEKAFTEWKGDLEQIDDVCIIGIKI